MNTARRSSKTPRFFYNDVTRTARAVMCCAADKGILLKINMCNLFTIFQHTISDTELVDDITFFAGCYTHFLSYVFHIYL